MRCPPWLSLVLLVALALPGVSVAQVLPPVAPPQTAGFPASVCTNTVGIGITATGLLTCAPVTPDLTSGLVPSGIDITTLGQVTQTHLTAPLPFAQGGHGLTGGQSGGLLYFLTPTALASSPLLPQDAPMIGGGSGGPPTTGTRSGTTLEFATVLGPHTSGKQLAFDPDGNLIASTADIGSGATGSVTSVFGRTGAITAQPGDYTAAQVTHAADTTLANVFSHPSGQTMAQLVLPGTLMGTLTVRAPAFAGSSILILPAGSTDFSTTGGSGRVVRQDSTGAPLTVAALASSDLSDSASVCRTSPLCPGYQSALGFTPEDVARKNTNPALGTSTTDYPTQGAVKSYVDAGLATRQTLLGFAPEDTANKASSPSLGTSNTLFPTQGAVKGYVDTLAATKQPLLGFTPEDVTRKNASTALGTSNTDYPTQGAVKGYVDSGLATKQPLLAFTPENAANKSSDPALGTSTLLFPTQSAVKSYADTGLAGKQPLVTWGDGLSVAGATVAVASTQPRFLTNGGATNLTGGVSAQGKMQVMSDGRLQYTDGATTALLWSGYLTQSGLSWNVTPTSCTGDANGGKLTLVGTEIRCAADIGGTGGAGGVTSVFGRTGVITAQAGDYTASLVTNAADTTAANVFPHVSGQSMRQLILPGATSGSLTLKAAAVAGSSSLTLPAGTTDFSATGGAGQVLRQSSLGGPLTVGPLDFASLTGTGSVCLASGTCTGYQPTLTWGTGLTVTGTTAAVASTEPGFLTLGSIDLPVGPSQGGAMQVLATGQLQYTDNAAPPARWSGYLVNPGGAFGTLQMTTGLHDLQAYGGSRCEVADQFVTELTTTGAVRCAAPGLSTAPVLLAASTSGFPQGVNLGAFSTGLLLSTVSGGIATLSSKAVPLGAIVGTTDAQELENKRITPRTAPLDNTTPLVVDLGVELSTISALSQPTTFANPIGQAKPGQIVRIQAQTVLPQPLIWDSFWSADTGFALPATTSGSGTVDVFWFQYNGGTGKLDLIYNSQLARLTQPNGVPAGTYTCPASLTVDPRGAITAISNGTCGGGTASAAGGTGDVQFQQASLLAADPGNFTYDPYSHTLLLANHQTSLGGTVLEFVDTRGQLGLLMGPGVLGAARRLWQLPPESGMLCVSGGSCFSSVVDVSGTPTVGQAAEFLDANTLQGVGTLGSGSYVKGTNATLTTPILTNPTIAALANLTSNGYVKTSGGNGTLGIDTNVLAVETGVQTLTSSSTYTCVRNGPSTQPMLNTCKMSMTGATGTVTIQTSGTLQDGDRFLIRLRCTNSQTIAYAANVINSLNVLGPTSCPADTSKEVLVGLLYSSDTAKLQVVASTQ